MEDSNVDPWELARDRYLEDLSEDEKALFEKATIENIFYGASTAQKLHEADSKTRLAARKLKPLVAALEQYGKALDVYSNASPTIMCPLWGSIRVVLQLAGAFDKYFAKLVDMFSRIGDVLPRFQAFRQLFPNHQRLLQVMSIAYLDIIKFCVEAKRTFREGNKLRGIRIAWKGVWKTFDSRFDDSLAEFRVHKENVEKEAMLSHMIEAGKARDLELRDRALVETRRKEESRRRLLTQLSSVDADYKHRKLRQLRHRGTGDWITMMPDFVTWLVATGSSTLSCYGIPGSGKTVLASSVIDNLLARDESIQTAIAFHYCDYSDISTLTACNIFGTLVKQMLNAVEIPTALEQLIDRYYAHGTRTPDNQEVFNVLVETLKLFSKVHLVIDGLDECQKEECAVVLSSMKKLMTSDTPVVKIFLSSREEAYITSSLNAHQVIHVTKEIISPDIALFITEAVDERLRSREMVVHSQPLIQEIITGLVEGAQGMFLWVSFQLDDLCEATSDHEIRKTLRDLPKDLAETYNRILRKIKKSRGTSEKLDKVHKIFKWIICAERPLTIDELAEAIEIESTDKFWDSEKMTADGERLIRYCGSLVVFDKDTRAARLAHYTVQQFLTSVPVENSLACLHIDPATTNVQLGEACITYLSFSDFETQITRRRSPLPVGKTLLLDSAIDQVPFGKRLVKEVLTNWNHVRGAGSDGTNPVIDLTKHLVVSDGTIPLEKMHAKYRFLKYAIANWTWHTKMLTKDNQRLWNAFADVALKKPMTFEFRPWGKMQSQYDLQYPTIFNWAINAGHVALLHLIPYHDLDFYDIVTTQAQSSITAAARRGDTEVLKVLFQLPGLELRYLPTDEIVCDATDGRDELLELLLRLQANPNAESDKGRHALVCAFMRQQEAAFILLLQYGANADLECNKTAFDDNELMLFGPGSFPEQRIFKLLHLAVRTGHTACVSALLQRGAQVNIPLSSEFRGESPLQAAVSMRRHEIVEMLVHAGADVNAVDDNGMTALMFATIRCHFSVAQTLLEKGAAVNARSLTNRTALMEAAAKGNIHLVRLLLSAGAKIELLDQDWNTALDIARSSHARLEVLALLDDARIVQEQITPIIANPAISSGSLSMKIRNENSMSIGPIYSPWSPGPKAGSADSLGGADQGI